MDKIRFEQDKKIFFEKIKELHAEMKSSHDDIDIGISITYEREQIEPDEINNDILFATIG